MIIHLRLMMKTLVTAAVEVQVETILQGRAAAVRVLEMVTPDWGDQGRGGRKSEKATKVT